MLPRRTTTRGQIPTCSFRSRLHTSGWRCLQVFRLLLSRRLFQPDWACRPWRGNFLGCAGQGQWVGDIPFGTRRFRELVHLFKLTNEACLLHVFPFRQRQRWGRLETIFRPDWLTFKCVTIEPTTLGRLAVRNACSYEQGACGKGGGLRWSRNCHFLLMSVCLVRTKQARLCSGLSSSFGLDVWQDRGGHHRGRDFNIGPFEPHALDDQPD